MLGRRCVRAHSHGSFQDTAVQLTQLRLFLAAFLTLKVQQFTTHTHTAPASPGYWAVPDPRLFTAHFRGRPALPTVMCVSQTRARRVRRSDAAAAKAGPHQPAAAAAEGTELLSGASAGGQCQVRAAPRTLLPALILSLSDACACL